MSFKVFYLAEEDSKKVLDWLSKLKVVANVRIKPQETQSWIKSFKGNKSDFSNKTFNSFLDKIHSIRRSLNEDIILEILKEVNSWGFDNTILRYFPEFLIGDKVGEYLLRTDIETFKESFPKAKLTEYLAKIVAGSRSPELLEIFPKNSLTDSVARILINKRKREFLELFPETIQAKFSN